MSTKVKICGIRTLEAAQTAVSSGADFLGFIFVPSYRRYINPKDAKKIIDLVRKNVKVVGVFLNQPLEEVNKIVSDLNLDFVQLHGEESPDFVSKINTGVIKAFSLKSDFDLNSTRDLFKEYSPDYYLVDRQTIGEGPRLDPSRVASLTGEFPIFLSGGLTPDNIGDVLSSVRPFGVDVSSGVETNGEKDLEKITQFIDNVRKVENG